MKHIFTLSLILLSISLFGQERSLAPSENNVIGNSEMTGPTRTVATSAQSRTSEPVRTPYDVNDKYMGRAEEFLGNLTVTSLPADFPVFQKHTNLKDYNQLVTAFYLSHMDIVREAVKQKLRTPEK
jgi:hypothetical protein